MTAGSGPVENATHGLPADESHDAETIRRVADVLDANDGALRKKVQDSIRTYATGGSVKGAGSPTDDEIPPWFIGCRNGLIPKERPCGRGPCCLSEGHEGECKL